jgi:uncharacterized membrane protein
MFGNGMLNPNTIGPAAGRGGRIILQGGHIVGRHLGAFGITGTVLGLILWAAVMVALILAIMTLIRNWRRPQYVSAMPAQLTGAATPAMSAASPEALRILEDRYARGEVNHEEYLERRKDLTGSS